MAQHTEKNEKLYTYSSLLYLSIQMEVISAEIYNRLAGWFYDHPESRKFFEEMFYDEMSHIQYLEQINKTLSQNLKNSGIEKEILEKAKEIHSFIEIASKSRPNNLDSTIELIHTIEKSGINWIYNYVCEFFVSLTGSTHTMKLFLQSHMNRLTTFDKAYSDLENRRAILANYAMPLRY